MKTSTKHIVIYVAFFISLLSFVTYLVLIDGIIFISAAHQASFIGGGY